MFFVEIISGDMGSEHRSYIVVSNSELLRVQELTGETSSEWYVTTRSGATGDNRVAGPFTTEEDAEDALDALVDRLGKVL